MKIKKLISFLIITLSIWILPHITSANHNFTEEHIWPISGTETPDLPLSSTFGPRLKASSNYTYDFHRGIDIKTECYSDIHAIIGGIITKNGDNHSGYSDKMVQIEHIKPNGEVYYSNYMHIASSSVSIGQTVTKGQVIAKSGESGIEDSGICLDDSIHPFPESGFDHLHFEIRDNGKLQKHAIHPLNALPYIDFGSNGSGIASELTIDTVKMPEKNTLVTQITVQTPSITPDFKSIDLIIKSNNTIIQQDGFNIENANYENTPFNSTTNSSDLSILDNSQFKKILIEPEKFNDSNTYKTIQFTFESEIPECIKELEITGVTHDLWNNSNLSVVSTSNAITEWGSSHTINECQNTSEDNTLIDNSLENTENNNSSDENIIVNNNIEIGTEQGSENNTENSLKTGSEYKGKVNAKYLKPTPVTAIPLEPLKDINNHWAKNEIKILYQKTIISGYQNNFFIPNKAINRAEFTKMVIKALNIEILSNNNYFFDVPTIQWYSPYISTAKELNLITGYSNRIFKPYNEITRAEAIKILMAAKGETITMNLPTSFYDITNHWAKDIIATAKYQKYIQGYPDNTFKPDNSLTRAEAATLIYNILIKEEY